MIKFDIVTKDNLAEAIKAQNEIFTNDNGFDDGTVDFIKGVSTKPDQEFSFVEHYLVKDNHDIVGCTGLYAYHNNPKEAWLSWFGVLPAARKKGYGEQILAATKGLAQRKGFTALRLYTSGKLYSKACNLYEKLGFTGEKYTKELPLNLMGLDERVYSISLTDQPVTPWNNRRLHIFRHELFDSILLTEKKKQKMLAQVMQEKAQQN